MRKPLLIALLALALAAGAGVFLLRREIFAETSPAARGRLVAQRAGCFGCHGEAPTRRLANVAVKPDGARLLGTEEKGPRVPGMYEDDPKEVREWILNGSAGEKKPGEDQRAIHMPAFRERLSEREVEDLVAYCTLHARPPAPEPTDDAERDLLLRGEALARGLGCFACHGELGQGGVGNPGALKGYVPGFFGDDFLALTAEGDPEQVREWIRDGVPKGFLDGRLARYFTERQVVQMPAYGPFLKEGELDLLVRWCLAIHARGPLDAARLAELRRVMKGPEKPTND